MRPVFFQKSASRGRLGRMVKEYTPTVPSGPPQEPGVEPLQLDDELAPGDLAGEYVIMGKIASGGCGTVYTAQHRLLGRRAAVKVLHRDLKASNVVVVKEGDPPRVKLLDFGIAKLMRSAPGERGLTAAGVRIGTPYAMAPEQVRGAAVDHRVDIYGLGVLLFQPLTGRYPFVSGDPVEMERLHVESPPPRPSAMAPVSPDIDAIVLRCMEKDAARRFPDITAFVDALRTAVKGARAAAAAGKTGVAIYV